MPRALNVQRTAWISILLISTASAQKLDTSALGREDRFAQLSEQLKKGTIDPGELNEWSGLALDSSRFDEWSTLKPNINPGLIPTEMLTPYASLLFTSALDTTQWISLSKLAHASGIDEIQWRLAGYLRTKWPDEEYRKSAFSRGHPALQELVPETKETASLQFMLTASFILLTLYAIALARKRARNKYSVEQDLPTPAIIAQLKELLNDGSQPQRYQIALTELELSLFYQSIEGEFKNKSLWNQLSEKQKLLLFLILRGHAVTDCADYFEVSVGHLYNQRSELRGICGLVDGESFEQLFDSSTNNG